MKKRIFSALLFAAALLSVMCACSLSQEPSKEVDPAILMFLGSKEDLNSGELYIQRIGEEKEQLASTALKDEYLLAPKTQSVLVLNKKNELYLQAETEGKVKISNDVLKSSYSFSEDESTIAFLVKNGDKSDLYIQKIGQDKEKITSGLPGGASKSNYKLSKDGSTILFLDAEGALYKWSAGADKEKLANDVKSFNAYADNEAYSYLNKDSISYVKFANDIETQRISVSDIASLQLSENGLMAVFTGGYNWEKGYGELYALIKGGDSVKIASNVKSFFVAGNNNLYYVNDESSLYLKKLPKVNENTYKNSGDFVDKINNGDKIKQGSNVLYHKISADGKNTAFIDGDKNLYLCYNEGEKVKVASDVSSVRVFNDRLIFVNEEKQLYLNSVIEDTGAVKDNNKMIAQMLNNFSVMNDGKHIAFTTTESNSITLITDGQKVESILEDCNAYDIILMHNEKTFEKKLLLSDIVGIYINESLGVAYKINSDKQFLYYEKGASTELSPLKVNGINRMTAELKSDNAESILSKNNVTFSVSASGDRSITIGGTTYALKVSDEAGLKTELERQKKAEADAKAAAAKKAAAEKAAAELKARKQQRENEGESYYYDGVYVTSYETLYYSPNYSSASSNNYIDNHWADVYDYQVSSDGWTVWLKTYDSNGTAWWIAR